MKEETRQKTSSLNKHGGPTAAASQISADKLKSITSMATSLVAKATEAENVFSIPQVIDNFVPKRVGHVEH